MLEPPNLSDDAIIACLNAAYALPMRSAPIREVSFLPIGADQDSALYRAVADDGTPYFLKLRRGALFEASVAVLHWLHAQGVPKVIPPLTASDGALWARLEPFTVVLYPFIAGQNGMDAPLAEPQLVEFGAALRRLHDADLPPALRRGIPHEDYTPYWREQVRMFLDLASERAFADPVAAETARLLRAKRSDLEHCAGRAESLARGLAGQAGRACLCHGDIHAWNILATGRGEFYIVDWDTLVYAPKERDLMFIGAWAGQWDSAREREAFYAGYGPAAIDRAALAYYRYDRIVQDVVAYCEPLLLTDEGGADRAEMYRQLESNFVPGGVLDYARATEQES